RRRLGLGRLGLGRLGGRGRLAAGGEDRKRCQREARTQHLAPGYKRPLQVSPKSATVLAHQILRQEHTSGGTKMSEARLSSALLSRKHSVNTAKNWAEPPGAFFRFVPGAAFGRAAFGHTIQPAKRKIKRFG